MQVLKEELKQELIDKAVEEFYIKGFEKASIRKIVKAAGTTIGNFYNYFKSKEELFYSITTPVYENIVYHIKNHNDEDDYSLTNINIDELNKILTSSVKQIDTTFLDFDKDMYKKIIILFHGSKGTKYENVKSNIKFFIAEHILDHMNALSKDKITDVDYYEYLSKVLAAGVVEGLLEIIESDYENKGKLIIDYIVFQIYGILKMKM